MRYQRQMRAAITHRDVIAWQEAMALVEDVYRDTARFPPEEMTHLAAKIRHAALVLPTCLADGATRGTIEALLHCLSVSCGLLAALDTQLEIAVRLGYLAPNACVVIRARRLGTLMSGLRQGLQNEAVRQPRVGAFEHPAAKRHGVSARSPRARLKSPVAGHSSRLITS